MLQNYIQFKRTESNVIFTKVKIKCDRMTAYRGIFEKLKSERFNFHNKEIKKKKIRIKVGSYKFQSHLILFYKF